MRVRTTSRNTALQNLGDELDDGFVRFYDGPVPISPDIGVGLNTLIVECELSSPACAAPAGGTRAFNAILAGVVVASGTPTFARFVAADGTTAVVDMSVPEEVTLLKPDWIIGEPFIGPSVVWSLPVGT